MGSIITGSQITNVVFIACKTKKCEHIFLARKLEEVIVCCTMYQGPSNDRNQTGRQRWRVVRSQSALSSRPTALSRNVVVVDQQKRTRTRMRRSALRIDRR